MGGIDPTFTTMPLELQTIYHGPSSPGGQSDSTMSIPREPSSTGPRRGGDDLIDLFYKHFHPAHPFIIPRKTYIDSPLTLPKPLRAVIHYLASHYVPGTNQNALETAAKGIFSDDVPDDGYRVQGLLLYAMTCFSRFTQEEGAKALEQAIDIALRIGMKRQSFAIQHGRNDPTIQESWRRTWWSLFIVEATVVVTDPQVEAIDASITNYFLSLPPTKREVIGQCGLVDENLLVAHLLINWAAISLHRPRSSLTFIRNHYRTTCTRAEAAGLPALAYSSHTAKALRAANNIVNLATVQHSMINAPPVLMCGITTAATVHLPAYSLVLRHARMIDTFFGRTIGRGCSGG